MVFLLPFHCLSSFLQKHPLSNLSGINVKTIYDRIIEVLTGENETERPSRHAPFVSPPAHKCTKCDSVHCKIDHHASELVCEDCGKVETLTGSQDFKSYEETQGSHQIVFDNKPSEEIGRFIDFRNEIDHWNRYPSSLVVLDEESIFKTLQRAAILKKGSITERVISCIFIHILEEKEDLISYSILVRKGMATNKIEFIPPVVKRCPTCNFALSSDVSNKRHKCGWGKKTGRGEKKICFQI